MQNQDSLVTLLGRLTKDAVTKNPKKAKQPVTELSVAVNSAGKSQTMFIDVAIWGEAYAELLKAVLKGTEVVVLARLKFEKWETQGIKFSRHSLVASHVSIVPSAPHEEVVVDVVVDDELGTDVVDEVMTEELAD